MEGFLWAKKNRRLGAFLAYRHFSSKKVYTEEYVHQNVLRLYTKLVTPAHVRTLNLSNFGHG